MKRNNLLTMILTLITAILLSAVPLFAGGPLLVDAATKTPFAYGTGDVQVFTDLSDLGPLSNVQADALTSFGFDQWTSVATASFSAIVAGEIELAGVPTEITLANIDQVVGPDNGGGIYVVYDNDGDILSNFFGAPPGVLGLAIPEHTTGTTITESFVVINGTTVDPADTDGARYAGVFTHEFGHSINLAHSQTNGGIIFFGDATAPVSCSTPPYSGGPAIADIETMYPFIDISATGTGQAQSEVNQLDDIASLSNIYPAAGWPGDFATITGTIFLADGLTELTGANVIARNIANPFGDAISAISGDFTQGQLGPDGIYTLNGLTPGADYAVYVDQILAGGFSTPDGGTIILPGPEEFWNLNESADPNIDDPCDFTALNSPAGGFEIADVIFNSSGGVLPLGDDDAVEITLPFPFTFCNATYTSVFVCSNGFISFADSGQANRDFSPSVQEFIDGPPRIAGVWTDLSPNNAGSVLIDDSTPGEFRVSFIDVPEFGLTNVNNFTITLKVDSTYNVTYGTVNATGGLAGRTPGQGFAIDDGETDLSAEPQPIGVDADLVYEFFEAADNDLEGLSLDFAPCELSTDPRITVAPDTLKFEVFVGGMDTTDLVIANIAPPGGPTLDFTITENTPAKTGNGRAVIADMLTTGKDAILLPSADLCPWLDFTPDAGNIAGQEDLAVEVSVDATGLVPNVYNCELVINSNAVNAAEVVVPVILTVKVSFDLHQFVFLANDNVSVDQQVDSEGDIFSNRRLRFREGAPSTHTGDLMALDRLDIGVDQTINGDVIAGNRINNRGIVNGTITAFAVLDSFKLPALSFTAGGDDFEIFRGDTLTLAPGSYGNIQVKVGSVLLLSSGDYFFESIRLEALSLLSVDVASGPVSVNITDNLSFRNDSRVEIAPFGEIGSTELTFNTLQTGDVKIGQSASVLGSIIAPTASVEIKDNVVFKGAVCAQRIQAQQGVTFRHHNSAMPLPTPVPFAVEKDGVEEIAAIPLVYALEQNYPNPFNPSTTIRFALPEAGEVSLKIFNMRGQVVRTLASNTFESGVHNITWDATTDTGEKVASGIYFYQLISQQFNQVKKMILMK